MSELEVAHFFVHSWAIAKNFGRSSFSCCGEHQRDGQGNPTEHLTAATSGSYGSSGRGLFTYRSAV